MNMNKKIVKATVAVTTLSLLAATGCGNTNTNTAENTVTDANTQDNAETNTDVIESTENSEVVETVKKAAGISGVNADVNKDETVYVTANADGSTKKIIVSDWLKNADAQSVLNDISDLKDIENVKGYEEFVQNTDGSLTWNANGADIYYQGTSDKALPVDMKITYTLDGKEISAKDLAGKSGRLVMRFDYTNNSKQTVKINDKDTDIYTPFTVVTGMMLSSDNASNVTVSSGKVVSDGNGIVVVGMAMPGLKDSLGLADKEVDVDIPDYVEVTADVNDFELTTTATVMMSDLLSDMNIDEINSFDDLEGDLDTLTDASTKLVDGTGELSDATVTLKDGTSELKDGAIQLDDGITEANDGVKEIVKNYPDAVDGANKLAEGLDTLNKKVKAFPKLAGKLDTTKSENDTKASEMESNTLPADQASVQSAVASTVANCVTPAVTAGVTTAANVIAQASANATAATISSYVTTAVAAQADTIAALTGQFVQAGLLDPETAQTYATAIVAGQVAQSLSTSEQLQAQIGAAVQEAAGSAVAGSQEAIAQSAMAAAQAVDTSAVTTAVTQLATDYANYGSYLGISGAIGEIRGQLSDETLNELTSGVKQLKEGSKNLAEGITKLSDATGKLSTGIGQIKEGSGKLKDGTVELDDGAAKLKDGAFTLKDGMNEFNNDGIMKLSDAFNDDLLPVKDKLTAIKDAGEGYQVYTQLGEGQTGSVKFIITTDGISK